jgi:hypothetical protein
MQKMTYENPVAEMEARVSQYMQRGMDKATAQVAVMEADPVLQREYGQAMRNHPRVAGAAARTEVAQRIQAEQQKSPGLSRAQAGMRVFRKNEQLRQRFVAAGQKQAPPADAPAPISEKEKMEIVAEVERRVGCLKATGVPHGKAVCLVFARDAELHWRYLSAHNAGKSIPRR